MHQDFSGKNLRGRSFKGQNLEGSDFSYADIRGANFTGANLQNANFRHAKCGVQKRWAIFLVCVSCLLSAISGLFSGFTGGLISLILVGLPDGRQVADWSALIVVIVVFIIIHRQGFNSFFSIAGFIAIALAIAGRRDLASIIGIAINFAIAITITIAIAIAFGIGIAIGIAIADTIALIIATAIAITFAIAGAIALIFTTFLVLTASIAGYGAGDPTFPGSATFVRAIAIAIAGTLLSAYIAWRAMKGDEKYSLIQKRAVAFTAFGGTSFRHADLTGANFTQATLKNTDLRQATLIRTCFHNTRKLNWWSFVRV